METRIRKVAIFPRAAALDGMILGMSPFLTTLDGWVAACLYPAAVAILISGIDDLVLNAL